MQLFRFRHLIATILLLCSLSAKAQYGILYTPEEDLSSSLVTDIIQDRDGFIWIATRNGLNFYDGYKFKVMKADMPGCEGLTSNYINRIMQAKDGTIYICTNSSVTRYKNSKFSPVTMKDVKGKKIKTYVTSIVQRHDGSILIGTSGFGVMRMADDGTCQSLPISIGKTSHVQYLMEDNHDNLWIITEHEGVYVYTKSHKLRHINLGNNTDEATCASEDKYNNIYISTRHNGLYCYSQGKLTAIPGTSGLSINTVYVDSKGKVLIGCDGKGIWQYDPQTKALSSNVFYGYNFDLSKSKATSFAEDNRGNLWIGLMQKGVFLQPKNDTPFNYMGYKMGKLNLIGSNSVSACLIDHRGHFWIGTDKDGIYHLDSNHKLVAHLTNVPSTTLTLSEDGKGRIWVGSFAEGCGWIDPASGQYHNVDLRLGKGYGIYDIIYDSHDNIWFATMGQGLICLTPDGKTRRYRVTKNAENNTKINSLPNDYISRLALSRDGKRLYICSSIGLCCLNLATMSWTDTFGANVTNFGSFSHCVYVDSKERVWYGAENGLFCYQNGKLKKTYGKEDGLSDNIIVSVCEDGAGKIWIGTPNGLSCLNPKDGLIHKYYREDGLQSNEFSDAAISANSKGNVILAGGPAGIIWFNPIAIKDHKLNAEVKITALIMGNTNVTDSMKSGFFNITDKPVIRSDHFELSHSDNTFTIQLSTFTFENTNSISYLYSINGDEWKRLQPGDNEIQLSHMAAGTYHFRVKAVSNNQETPVKKFTVVVRPAWYASLPARIFYLLLFAAFVWLYLKRRQRKEQERLTLQEHIHAEEMSEAKIRFFVNMSHEIRTPMTLIVTPLQSLMKEDKDSHRQGIYRLMQRNADRILHLVNQMLDLRKIDKGQMAMHMSETDYVGFVNDICQTFSQLAKSKKIDLTFHHEDDVLPVWIDRSNYDKVVVNVLSNAFKYTPSGGKIDITMTKKDGNVQLSVKDSGCGIPPDRLENIFQRFYQVASRENSSKAGTGIGLDLTRSIVELHYGTIVARNNSDGPGAEFIITIPLGNSHLRPEEMVSAPEQESRSKIVSDDLQEEEIMEQEASPAPSRSKAHITVVEDDDEILEYLRQELSKDYVVSTCHNGKEGLQQVLKDHPDLVISDIMMPEMDGNTLCMKIKSNINTNSTPVILLTAKNLEEDKLEGLETGADAYIVKPFNMDILRRTIINLLNSRRIMKLKFSGKEGQDDKVKEVKMSTPDEKLLNRIMEVINKHIDDSDLTVDMIASEVGISRIHLHRKMKELTNQSPHVFIRNVRLKQAARLLQDPRQSISEVTYACGFSNISSFSTIFKNAYGVPPREYQQRNANNKK